MDHVKKLVGKHIYLSPHIEEDASAFYRWRNDLSMTELCGSPTRTTSYDAELADTKKRMQGPDHHFSILTLDTDTLIGYCAIRDLNLLHQSARIGMYIGDKDCRGKGYGQEAMGLLTAFGFDYLNMHRITLSVLDFNKSAIACYEKVGYRQCGRAHEAFRLHGTWHDWIEMEILESWWRDMEHKS